MKVENHDPAIPPVSPESSATPPVASESTSTPPIASPPAAAIDPKYVSLLEGTIAEQNRRLQAIETRQASAPVAPAAPAKTKEERRQEFYDDPNSATRSVIREELAATIGPIQEFVAQFRGASAVDRLVDTAKINPRFAPHWSPALERYVREQAAGVDPSRLNDSTMNFLVASGIGLVTAGMLEGAAPPAPTAPPVATSTQPPPSSPPMPTPPYMRPSAPAGPTDQPRTPTFEPLNENEKRLLREYNAGKPADKQMTEAQYRKWQELPSGEVAFTEFDKPATPAR